MGVGKLRRGLLFCCDAGRCCSLRPFGFAACVFPALSGLGSHCLQVSMRWYGSSGRRGLANSWFDPLCCQLLADATLDAGRCRWCCEDNYEIALPLDGVRFESLGRPFVAAMFKFFRDTRFTWGLVSSKESKKCKGGSYIVGCCAGRYPGAKSWCGRRRCGSKAPARVRVAHHIVGRWGVYSLCLLLADCA